MAAWSSDEIAKGLIAALLTGLTTIAYKKLKPTFRLIRKFFNVVRVDVLIKELDVIKNELYIMRQEKIATYHCDKDPILIKNTSGEMEYVNPAFVDLTGAENAEDCLGYGFVTSIHPLDREEADKLRLLMNSHPSNAFGYVRWKNKQTGNTIFTSYRTKLICDSDTKLIKTLIRLYIITE